MAATRAFVPVVYPRQGTIRVGVAPDEVPLPPRIESETTEFAAGPNRFDDPLGRYVMRYTATTLRGCMIELLARFRSNSEAESLLEAVQGVNDGDLPSDPGDEEGPDVSPVAGSTPSRARALVEWLARQRLVVLQLVEQVTVVDALDGELLRELNKHPLVAEQLAVSALSRDGYVQRLESGVMGLGGPTGRPITNAASRAVHEWLADVVGWRYPSRLDPAEVCWALYADRVPNRPLRTTPLSPGDPLHRAAVQSAANYLEVALPPDWA